VSATTPEMSDSASQRERELAEQRACKSALKPNRGVNGGERERHRDHGTDKFTSAQYRGVHRTSAVA